MTTLKLSELQLVARKGRRARLRKSIRDCLLEQQDPSASAFQITSRRLYADGLIDNLGLAQQWVQTSSLIQRAALCRDIMTDMLA